MCLIRAECNKRLSTAIGATPTKDVNRLRNRANTTDIIVYLHSILLERRKELDCEGFRLYVIKRLQRSVGTLNYNNDSLVFPIQQREIDTNPN